MTAGPGVQLALGTVQFGLAYGVAGRGQPVPEREARAILERAAAHGIRRLDTAAAYGDIEQRLAGLAAGLPFEMVSKIPELPKGLEARAAQAFVSEAIESSHQRLGRALRGMLFHRSEDLDEAHGRAIWECAAASAGRFGLRIGASFYDPIAATRLRRSYPIEMAQVPANALDQRLAGAMAGLGDVEVTVRSAFLQGLLLMPLDAAAAKVPAAAQALARWHAWREDRGLSPLIAALSVAKQMSGVRYCVVGVDTAAQLDEIVEAWNAAEPAGAAELATADPQVIDPRRWASAA